MLLLTISAILAAVPMTFPELYLISWIAFVPYFVAIIRKNSKGNVIRAAVRGFYFGFVYHICIYYWLIWLHPLDYMGFSNGMSLVIVIAGWVGASFLKALPFCIPTLACRILSKRISTPLCIVFSGVFCVLLAQWFAGIGEIPFPWARISLGHYRAPVLIQAASVLGSEGVDFIILAVNALLATAIVSGTSNRKRLVAAALLLFGLNLGFGVLRFNTIQKDEPLTATVVQGNVKPEEKWNDESFKLYFGIYSRLTREAVTGQTELVVWPESAVPSNFYDRPENLEKLKALSLEIEVPIIAGVRWRIDGDKVNSMIFTDGKAVLTPYVKRVLVPFGEVMPFRNQMAKFEALLESVEFLTEDLGVGGEVVVWETEKGKIGSIICFESVFSNLVRHSVSKGAELLVTATNDSWLEDSPAVWQHLAHSVFRSVENARCNIRCANGGVCAFIDSRGQIIDAEFMATAGSLTGTVYFSDEPTFYTKAGYLFLPAGVFIQMLWCVTMVAGSNKKTFLLGNKKLA